jgi:hypothetical protein
MVPMFVNYRQKQKYYKDLLYTKNTLLHNVHVLAILQYIDTSFSYDV